MKEQIINTIHSIIKNEMMLSENTVIDNSMDLIDDLGADSIMLISIIVEIETTFKIAFSDNELTISNIRNIGRLINRIEELIHE